MSASFLRSGSLAKSQTFKQMITSDPIIRSGSALLNGLATTIGLWLLAVFMLLAITVQLQFDVAQAKLEDLRLAIVYSLMIASIGAAPASVVASRIMEDFSPAIISARTVTLSAFSGANSSVLAILVTLALGFEKGFLGVIFVALASLLSMHLTVCGIQYARGNRYRPTANTALGMLVAFALIASLGEGEWLQQSALACVLFGVSVAFFLTVGSEVIQATDHSAYSWDGSFIQDQPKGSSLTIAGVILSTIAIWIDKWIVWLGPTGIASAFGFRHAPLYDGPMFIAHLSIIPSLIAIGIILGGVLISGVGRLHRALERGDTYSLIGSEVERFIKTITQAVVRVTVLQVSVSTLLIVLAPTICHHLGYGFGKLWIIVLGSFSMMFLSVILSCSAVLLALRQSRLFFLLQLIFFTLGVLFAAIGVFLELPLGMSLLIAAGIASFVAGLFVFRSFDQILFRIFEYE